MANRADDMAVIRTRRVILSILLALFTGPSTATTVGMSKPSLAAVDASQSPSNGDVPSSEYRQAHTLVEIDAAGRRLNLFCTGSGSPTTLYEAGGGEDSTSFRRVQNRLSKTTRVCSYDRAGFGFSDATKQPSTAVNIVTDLHRLIEGAGIERPVVLVGHSSGGLYAMLYAATYPRDVAGLVLIDPMFVGQERAITAGWTPAQKKAWHTEDVQDVDQARHCLVIAKRGLLARAEFRKSACLDNPPNADAVIHEVLDQQLEQPKAQAALISETVDTMPSYAGGLSNAELSLSRAHFSFADKPLIVLTAADQFSDLPEPQRGEAFAAWKKGHDGLAAASTVGRNVVVPHASHFIQRDRPDVVEQVVREVVNRARLHADNP